MAFILDDICKKNLAYLNSMYQNNARPQYCLDSTNTCLQLEIGDTRDCLKDIKAKLAR